MVRDEPSYSRARRCVMRGRKPKPTAVHNLEGTVPRGRLAVRTDEPVAVGTLDDPPEWLTDSQKAGWRYALEHAPAGVLARIDRAVLTVWVVAEDIHRTAVLQVGSNLIIRSPIKGEPIQNPYLAVVNKQAMIMIRAASELGFSPAARPRFGQGGQVDPANEYGALGAPDGQPATRPN